jgi:hypothetical protein
LASDHARSRLDDEGRLVTKRQILHEKSLSRMVCPQASRISAVGRAIRACYSCRLFSAQLTYSQQQTYCICSRSFFLLVSRYLANEARPVQYYFLMTAIRFPYGSTGLPVIFRSVKSLDPTKGNRGKYARVSRFVCPPMAMLPYLDDAKHF